MRVVEARDGPADVGDTPEIQRAHERYVIERLGTAHVDRFYSSEPYGAHMSRALGAIDRRVDPGRSTVPISGTALRADPFRHRASLHPRVLAAAPGRPPADPGAARRDRRGPPRAGGAGIMEARRYFFVDTNALTTAVFARYYHGEPHPKLAAIADACSSRYDLVFLCEGDFPYQDTWDRSGPANRALLQRMVVEDLAARGIAATHLNDPIEARVGTVQRRLEHHHK